MKKAIVFIFVALLVACGGDDATSPTPVNLPDVAGTYSGNWLVQFRRHSDGYSGSFYCYGTVTFAQSANGALSGFVVVGPSCPASSYELTGRVSAGGAVTFTSGGPRPDVGQCPAPVGATYTGVVADRQLSARATVELVCPGPGEGPHTFDYILNVWSSS